MTYGRTTLFNGPELGLEMKEVPLPLEQLEPNQALVEIEATTVCGSDLWTYTGARETPIPITLGHEGVGRVVESTRRDLEPGTRVVWSIVDSCGRCPYCTDYDLPQKCDSLLKYGHSQQDFSGTYASHVVLRAGTTVLTVSPDLNDALACTLCCAWSTAEACLEHIPRNARRVLVAGMGMLGVSVAYLAQRNGCTVFVMENRDEKRELAREMGFETDLPREVDAVIEAAGSVAAFEDALSHLRVGGTAVVAGLVHPNSMLTIPAENLVKNCWDWVGVHNYNPRHLHRALVNSYGFQQLIEPSRVFSQSFPLDDLDGAIHEALSGRWLRVLVRP